MRASRLCSVLFAAAALLASVPAFAQHTKLWSPTTVTRFESAAVAQKTQFLSDYRSLALDLEGMRSALAQAPQESAVSKGGGMLLSIPNPAGSFDTFRVIEREIAAPEVLAEASGLKTYLGVGVTEPGARTAITVSPRSLRVYVSSSGGDYTISPLSPTDHSRHLIYYAANDHSSQGACKPLETLPFTTLSASRQLTPGAGSINMMTFRIAFIVTAETVGRIDGIPGPDAFQDYFVAGPGAGHDDTVDAVVAITNFISALYERDTATRFYLILVHTFDPQFTKPDPPNDADPMNGDPFEVDDPDLNTKAQRFLDQFAGDGSYDVGQVLTEPNKGGSAFLSTVGITGQKGMANSGINPTVIAHELGHQFGAGHSFNSTDSAACSGQRMPNSAYEPGSGSTLMSYAGACGFENVQNGQSFYFNHNSIREITVIRNRVISDGRPLPIGNTPPVIDAGKDYTIPRGTQFFLKAVATDNDGDSLLVNWEQRDLGPSTPGAISNQAARPLFRSYPPAAAKTRFMPNLTDIINATNGQNSFAWEQLPNVDRVLNFVATVRDDGIDCPLSTQDAMKVTVAGEQFRITSPHLPAAWGTGTKQMVRWNVGASQPLSPTVNILISYDNGRSYETGGATLLKGATRNDGAEEITVPIGRTSGQARIVIESIGNIFFDYADTSVAVTDSIALVLNPNVIVGGNSTTGTVTINPAAGAGGQVITLTDDGPEVTTPASITIPAGSKSGSFTAPTTVVAAQVVRTIIARRGTVSSSATLTIQPKNVVVLDITPPGVIGGAQATGVVKVNQPAPEGGLTITLKIINPGSGPYATLSTNQVVIPEGASTSPTFTIQTKSLSSDYTLNVAASHPVRGTGYDTLVIRGLKFNFTVDPTTVLGGFQHPKGSIVLTENAPAGGTVFQVTSSDTTTATVPPTVTVNELTSQTEFTITTQKPTAAKTVTITVKSNTLPSPVSRAVAIAVKPLAIRLTMLPNAVVGGLRNSRGTIKLDRPAPPNGLEMTLTSSEPTSASVPATVTIPEGSTFVDFQAVTSEVRTTRTAVITVRLMTGEAVSTANLSVVPLKLSFRLDPSSVIGGVGQCTGTVTVNDLCELADLQIFLTSSDPSVADVPGTATILQGQRSVQFPVTHNQVDSAVLVRMTAASSDKADAVTALAGLTVNPPSPDVISITINPSSLKGGANATGTITLNRPAPAAGVIVSLTKDPSASGSPFVVIPTSVKVTSGHTSVSFTIQTKTVSRQVGTTITAQAGEGSAGAVITMNP